MQAAKLTRTQWLICATAMLGFAFDIYEILVPAIVMRPMLMELGPFEPGTPQFNRWVGLMLFVPTMAGGLAGLVGGYLTDRIGRKRVLVFSIVLYGISAFCSGTSDSLAELMFWRCLTIMGVCVEFVAATAWLTELFTDRRQREAVLGFTQIGASFGNFFVAIAYYVAVTWGHEFPAVDGAHSAWRYTFMLGAIPVIPLILLRPFLPESPQWQARRAAGTLQRPSFAALFGPALRRRTLICTALVGCGYALAFGALQHIPRLVPTLTDVVDLARQQQEQMVSWIHLHNDVGSTIGRFGFALVAVYVIARRRILTVLQLAGLVVFPFTFLVAANGGHVLFGISCLFATMLISATYSFWGNTIPRMFPLHLRGTGESVAINIGGRVIGPSAALATTALSNYMPGVGVGTKLGQAAALVAVTATLLGLVLVRFLPEPPPADENQ